MSSVVSADEEIHISFSYLVTVKKYIFSRFVIATFFFCQIHLNNLFSSDNLLF